MITKYKPPGQWETTIDGSKYRCACKGCAFCTGEILDCHCDVDWDKLYNH